MTTDPTAREWNTEVVPLRAVDAETEVRLDEDKPPGPSYVDLTSGDSQRRAIIPEHWRTWENAKRHVSLAAARHGHLAAYHGLRSPAYFTRAVGFAAWGVIVTTGRLIAWWHIPGTTKLEWEAAANGLLNDHLRIHKAGKETRRARGTILALCLAGLAAAVVAMVVFAPWWGWALAAVALFVLFALAGRPAGKTITTKAELPAQVQPPDQDVITRARVAGHRRDQPRTARRRPDRLPVAGARGRARLAGRARPAVRRHRGHGDRPPPAAGLRAAQAARRRVARAGQPRARGPP